VIPTHYASFPMLSGTPEQLEAELDKRGVGAKVVTLPIG
jgi:L-ascorbate metabolism protein UlaG (beta-lactamase superfamily)